MANITLRLISSRNPIADPFTLDTLESIDEVIRQYQTCTPFEIRLKIQFNEQDDKEDIIQSLQVRCTLSQAPYQVELIDTEESTPLEEWKQTFQNIYHQKLTTWHLTLENTADVAIKTLTLAPSQTAYVALVVNDSVVNTAQQSTTISNIQPLAEDSLHTPATENEIRQALQEITEYLRPFGQDVGISNLSRLFRAATCEMSAIADFIHLFLSANPDNIAYVMSIPGFMTLNDCLNNWSPWFFRHFLSLAQNDVQKEGFLSLEHALSKMNEFWQKIACLGLKQTEPFAEYAYDFFDRIDQMQELIAITEDPIWAKHQTKSIFALNFDQSSTIFALKRSPCNWVHPAMLTEDNVLLKDFYIKAAQTMNKNAMIAFDSYVRHLTETKSTNEDEFKLLSWFLSLTAAPHIEALMAIIAWFNQQTREDQVALAAFCQNTDGLQLQHFYDDFKLAKKTRCHLLALLKFRHHCKTTLNITQEQWYYIYQLLGNQHSAIIQRIAENRPSHFEILIQLIFNLTVDEIQYTSFVETFNASDNQDLIINILYSLNLSSFNKLDTTHLLPCLAKPNSPEAWKTYVEFNYFKSNIDYTTILEGLKQVCTMVQEKIREIRYAALPILLYPTVDALLSTEIKILADEIFNNAGNIIHLINQRNYTQEQQLNHSLRFLLTIDTQIKELFKKEIKAVIFEQNPANIYARRAALYSFRIIGHIDLYEDTTLAALLNILSNDYQTIFTEERQQWWPILPEKGLKSLNNALMHSESIVAMTMNEFVVKKSIKSALATLLTNLEVSSDINPQEPLQFLGDIALDEASISGFSTRLNSFTLITTQWPIIEQNCREMNLSAPNIWTLCTQYQDSKISSYWYACFDILKALFEHQQITSLGNERFINLLKIILIRNERFPTGRDTTGIIEPDAVQDKGRKWQNLIFFLKDILASEHVDKSYFQCLFEGGLDSILDNGKKFDITSMAELIKLLGNDATVFAGSQEQASQIKALMLKIYSLQEKEPSDSIKILLRKLLTKENIQNSLDGIIDILEYIERYRTFNLLDIIINDKACSIADLQTLVEAFKQWSSDWQTCHDQACRPEHARETAQLTTMTRYNQTDGQKFQKNIQIAFKYLKNSFSSLWGWLAPRSQFYPQVVIQHLRPIYPANHPQVTPVALQPIQSPVAIDVWSIIKQRPYPSIKQLSEWFTEGTPAESKEKIEAFDVWPFQSTKPVLTNPSTSDYSSWLEALAYYHHGWTREDKHQIIVRLRYICENRAIYEELSRRELVDSFHQYRTTLNKIRPDSANFIHTQNQLICILATLYHKMTHKLPHPTQLLSLLVSLTYANQNVMAEVDTGEGKSTIIALLAILKWSKSANNTVIIYTQNKDLVEQDFYGKEHHILFKLLGINAHAIDEGSSADVLKPNGIYYTTKDEICAFCKKNGISVSMKHDVIIDEIDVYLDPNAQINMVKTNPMTTNMAWIYPQINAFVEMHSKSNTRCMQENWGIKLKQYIVTHNATETDRAYQLTAISQQQWQGWIQAALHVQALKENTHYIVQDLDSKQKTTIPIVHGRIKEGYQIAYASLPGILQLLHAKLGPSFTMPNETCYVEEMKPDFSNVDTVTGLSGSIGNSIEILIQEKRFQFEKIARIPRHKPNKVKYDPKKELKNKTELHAAIVSLLQANTEAPVLILCETIEGVEEIHSHIQQQQLTAKQLTLLVGKESSAKRKSWLSKTSEIHAGSNNSITIATLDMCGRGTDIIADHAEGLHVITVDNLDHRALAQAIGRTGRGAASGRVTQLYIAGKSNLCQSSHVYEPIITRATKPIELIELIEPIEPIEPKNDKFNDCIATLQADIPKTKTHQHWLHQLFFDTLAWCNPLAKDYKNRLDLAWSTFKDDPNHDHLQAFHNTLLAAKDLQERQAKDWFWRIDYWFIAWRPLNDWCQFAERHNIADYLVDDSDLQTPEDVKQKTQQHARQHILYLGHLMWQDKMTSLGFQLYSALLCSSDFLSKINTELLTQKIKIDVIAHELMQRYPHEATAFPNSLLENKASDPNEPSLTLQEFKQRIFDYKLAHKNKPIQGSYRPTFWTEIDNLDVENDRDFISQSPRRHSLKALNNYLLPH